MANDNFTLQSTEETRAGAMACMDALRIIDRIAASGNAESTWEECCQIEDNSIKAMQLMPEAFKASCKSRSRFYDDIKKGLMVPMVRIGANSVAVPEDEIAAINAAKIAGKSNDEIRQIVSRLVADRQDVAQSRVSASRTAKEDLQS